MILTEQQYENLNRRYFHGSKTGRLEKIGNTYDFLFLTTDFVYSAFYACDIDALEGRVFEFKLKEGLNIFNSRSQQDVLKIRAYIRKNNPEMDNDWYWKGLQGEDWTFLFEDTQYRRKTIEAIFNCGFDGFFDYEWSDGFKKSNQRDTEKGELLEKSPSVAIFNVDKIQKVAEYKYEDYFQFESFIKAFRKEKSLLIGYAVAIKDIKENIFEFVLDFARRFTSFLLYENVVDIIKNLDSFIPGDDYDSKVYDPKIFKECLQFGVSKNSRFELNESMQLVYHKDRERLRKILGKKDLIGIDKQRKEIFIKMHPKKHLNIKVKEGI